MSLVSFQDTRSRYESCIYILAMKIQKLKIPDILFTMIPENMKTQGVSGTKDMKGLHTKL